MYLRRPRVPIGLAIVAALALVVVGAMVMMAVPVGSAAPAAVPTPPPQATYRFDGWSYSLFTDPSAPGAAGVVVEYDHATPQDLHRYAAVNRVLAKQLVATGTKEFAVNVAFREGLSIDEFRAWASQHPIRVENFQMHVVTADGKHHGLQLAPASGDVVSAQALQRNLDRLTALYGKADVRGVMHVVGTIDAAAYDRLASDPAVFLADVTRSAVADHLAKNAPRVDQSKLTVVVPHVYAFMDKLGRENFR